MKKITVVESGLKFGPYDPDNLFEIEKFVKSTRQFDDIKIAEFALILQGKAPKICIVEAKSSSPHTGKPSEEFDKFIVEINSKLVNSLCLLVALCIRRHKDRYNELPRKFKSFNVGEVNFELILILRGHADEWNLKIAEQLSIKLDSQRKIWNHNLFHIKVLNDKQAIEKGYATVALK